MLASSLALLLGVYVAGLIRLWRSAGWGHGIRLREAAAFGAGWLVLVAALSSPMDEWSDRWLAAHMVQHELMMIVAAPLMALSAPLVSVLWAMPPGVRQRVVDVVRRTSVAAIWAFITAPPAVFVLHAVALWLWHVPVLYDY